MSLLCLVRYDDPSIYPYVTTREPLKGFSLNLVLENFNKCVDTFSSTHHRATVKNTAHENPQAFCERLECNPLIFIEAQMF